MDSIRQAGAFVLEHWPTFVELIVLALILLELRALSRHGKVVESEMHAIKDVTELLQKVRPLYSTLYIDKEEIMDLSIRFIDEANEVYAMGSISNLIETELKDGETGEVFNRRKQTINPKTLRHVEATRNLIQRGARYLRIMDCIPLQTEESIREISSNIAFFRRLMEGGDGPQVFHNSEILKGPGDFHFKCSDKRVVIRAGGHRNTYANVAIDITDANVVDQFRRYYNSLIASPRTVKLGLEDLRAIETYLDSQDPASQISTYLSSKMESSA